VLDPMNVPRYFPSENNLNLSFPFDSDVNENSQGQGQQQAAKARCFPVFRLVGRPSVLREPICCPFVFT